MFPPGNCALDSFRSTLTGARDFRETVVSHCSVVVGDVPLDAGKDKGDSEIVGYPESSCGLLNLKPLN